MSVNQLNKPLNGKGLLISDPLVRQQPTWRLVPKEALTSRIKTGRIAENLACYYLRRRGYVIRERNFASSRGEIDIIAEKMHADLKGYPTVVFVEVKAKTRTGGLSPVLSVSMSKRKKLTQMSKLWIGRHSKEKAVYRFDIAAIYIEKRKLPKITWYRNAFVPHEEFGW